MKQLSILTSERNAVRSAHVNLLIVYAALQHHICGPKVIGHSMAPCRIQRSGKDLDSVPTGRLYLSTIPNADESLPASAICSGM